MSFLQKIMNKGEREMKGSMELKNELFKIDGKGYKAYKALEGRYDFKKYVLSIDHVQGDPFASPSRVRVIIDNKVAQIPEELFDNKNKEIAVCDFLTRLFSKNIRNQSEKIFGSGKRNKQMSTRNIRKNSHYKK